MRNSTTDLREAWMHGKVVKCQVEFQKKYSCMHSSYNIIYYATFFVSALMTIECFCDCFIRITDCSIRVLTALLECLDVLYGIMQIRIPGRGLYLNHSMM